MLRVLVVLVLSASIACVSCASSTLIKSHPPGAEVYIDGQYRGEAPVTQKDTAVLGSSKTVVLRKDGYFDATGTIRKEELKVGPLIAGILLTVPLLWVLGYPSEYIFPLEPVPSSKE